MSDNNSPAGGVYGDDRRAANDHKLAAARLWAATGHPYLASAIFASPALPAPDLQRISIDRWWRIHADPAVVERSSVAQLGGELLHLSVHVLRDHAGRADAVGFTGQDELHHWVDAADAEINDDLPADLDRVSPPLVPEDLSCEQGRLAEEYYRRGVVREGEVNDCGSGAHGQAAGWEPPPPSSSSEQGVGDDDQQLLRRQVAADIARAESESVTAGLRRWAENQLQSRVDWRSELAAMIRRSVQSAAGAVDYSYRRPSRRGSTVDGVILPSLVQPTIEVAVVCDTSASVTNEELAVAVTEIDGLLRATGTRSVRVLACDDAVHTVSTATRGRDVCLLGGGGTDMAVGIEAATETQPRPQVVVVITDGFTPWPPQPPQARVVVALLEGNSPLEPPNPPAWAHVIRIPTSAAETTPWS